MKKSIFLKIFSGYFLIIILLAFLIILFALNPISNFYLENMRDELFKVCVSLNPTVETFLRDGKTAELDALIKSLGNEIDTRITIIRSDGVVLADSERDPGSMENHLYRPEVATALEGSTGSSIRFSETVNSDMLYVAIPVTLEGNLTAVTRSSFFLNDIMTIMNDLKLNIIQLAVIIVLFALAGSALVSRSFSSPIRALVNGFNKFASGDFSSRIHLKSRDEIRELADNFNTMAVNVEKLFSELSFQKDMLNTVISSMQEGLVALDKKGKIILFNESFVKLFNCSDIEGKFFWEAVQAADFQTFVKNILTKKSNITEEIELKDSSLLVSGTYLSSKQEVIIVCYNITELKKFDEMKKELIGNVSHELRTPLTAIKGYAETLTEGLNEEQRKYLDIINKHTDRLINIVQDLLTLSEFENKNSALTLEDTDMDKLLNHTVKIFHKKLEDKGLSLKIDVDKDLPAIKADEFKLEQLLINLIDNAIQYTDSGGVSISVKLENNNMIIAVKDTGIGIEKKHQDRIFKRFFVTNKSRSRMHGGTGLGLSIVKHIVLLHKGRIEVDSSPGKGTTFTTTLPISP